MICVQSHNSTVLKRCILLGITLLILWSSLHAQQIELLARPYHCNLKKGKVKDFLEEINNKSGIIIEYASSSLELEKIIELDGNETSLGAVLQKVLHSQRVKLQKLNNKIILVPATSVINTDAFVPSYTFYGFVKDEFGKEPLIDATIQEKQSRRGILTNSHGFFSLTLSEGTHQVEISYSGYFRKLIDIYLHSNKRFDIELSARKEIQEEVIVVSGNGLKRNGSDKISTDEEGEINYFMGENDPIRSAYLLPGVKNITESFSNMLVRGGSTDENLFLLDGNPVYNPTHMLGSLSIVNQTSVKSMRLFKNDFPAKYGGALSSVIDVYTKDGNMEHWQGEANAGLLAGSFTLEGPIVKNKTATMVSFRHSWPVSGLKIFQKNIDPDFYDLHLKLTHLLDKNDKLMINFYTGRDRIKQTQDNADNLHRWGNIVASAGWNRVIGAKSYVNTSVNMSHYDNLGGFQYTLYDQNNVPIQTKSLGTFASIVKYNARSTAEITITNKTKLNIGVEFARTIIKPFDTKLSSQLEENTSNFKSFDPLPFNELSGYAESELRLTKKLFIRPGLRFTDYHFSNYNFVGFEPRFFISYRTGHSQQVYFSVNRMTQYLHLVTSPYLGVNSDLWVPSTKILKPEQSESYNLGYSMITKNGFRLSADGYWRQLKNVTNYTEGKSYFINETNWQKNIETGKGWSYGIEWIVQKNAKKISVHAAYTLSWSWRQFYDINNGEKFPFKYDRRHNINAGFVYHPNKWLNFSALWSFATGDAFSLPDYIYPDYDNAQQIINPDDLLKNYRFIYHYSLVNQYRTSPYQRLDFAITYHTPKQKKIRSIITAGVYNVYGSPDQYAYDLRGSLNDKSIIIEQRNKLFDLTPYLSYTLKF
ncbi:MAG: TonB-dependent receptor [Sphingobacteriales bacterium]|nr:MAG: TonB-dependent receptor [Sphingobacteriales bacterium]